MFFGRRSRAAARRPAVVKLSVTPLEDRSVPAAGPLPATVPGQVGQAVAQFWQAFKGQTLQTLTTNPLGGATAAGQVNLVEGMAAGLKGQLDGLLASGAAGPADALVDVRLGQVVAEAEAIKALAASRDPAVMPHDVLLLVGLQGTQQTAVTAALALMNRGLFTAQDGAFFVQLHRLPQAVVNILVTQSQQVAAALAAAAAAAAAQAQHAPVGSGGGSFTGGGPATQSPNTQLKISGIPDGQITTTSSTFSTFTVLNEDETPADPVIVKVASSDTQLFPDSSIQLTESAIGIWQLRLFPAGGRTGTATITVTATDAGGHSAVTTFKVTVLPPSVGGSGGSGNGGSNGGSGNGGSNGGSGGYTYIAGPVVGTYRNSSTYVTSDDGFNSDPNSNWPPPQDVTVKLNADGTGSVTVSPFAYPGDRQFSGTFRYTVSTGSSGETRVKAGTSGVDPVYLNVGLAVDSSGARELVGDLEVTRGTQDLAFTQFAETPGNKFHVVKIA